MAEFDALADTTFMYQLHECSFFDKAKFRLFLSAVRDLTDFYVENGKTDAYTAVACGVVDSFAYIMHMFYCHLDSNDMFEIENYEDIKDEVPAYFEGMRELMRELAACGTK